MNEDDSEPLYLRRRRAFTAPAFPSMLRDSHGPLTARACQNEVGAPPGLSGGPPGLL